MSKTSYTEVLPTLERIIMQTIVDRLHRMNYNQTHTAVSLNISRNMVRKYMIMNNAIRNNAIRNNAIRNNDLRTNALKTNKL